MGRRIGRRRGSVVRVFLLGRGGRSVRLGCLGLRSVDVSPIIYKIRPLIPGQLDLGNRIGSVGADRTRYLVVQAHVVGIDRVYQRR
jgi:hypothetical protein